MTTEKVFNPRRGALGKGISSLLGGINESDSDHLSQTAVKKSINPDGSEVLKLKVTDIEPNPEQPRKLFDEKALQELADSIRQDGVLQPIIVSKTTKNGRYMIVAGERRWRATQKAGLQTIPVIVKEGATEDLLRLALIENIQRADLNVIEEAEAYSSLIKDHGLTQEQCADKVGKDRTTVTNALRLLTLPREIQDDVVENRLSMGHARALLSLEDKKQMLRARDIVIKKQLNVRQTEQLCRDAKKGVAKTSKPKTDAADLEYIAENLRGYLQTKVKIAGSADKGRVEICYFSPAELERILSRMGFNI